MKCEKCGSEHLIALVTFDHEFQQVKGQWKLIRVYEQDPGDDAQIVCAECDHEMFESIDTGGKER